MIRYIYLGLLALSAAGIYTGCAAHHRITVCVAETLDRPTGEIRPVLVCGEPEDVDEFMQIKERRSF